MVHGLHVLKGLLCSRAHLAKFPPFQKRPQPLHLSTLRASRVYIQSACYRYRKSSMHRSLNAKLSACLASIDSVTVRKHTGSVRDFLERVTGAIINRYLRVELLVSKRNLASGCLGLARAEILAFYFPSGAGMARASATKSRAQESWS